MTDARILDRSYRAYDGPRSGLIGAMRTVTAHSMRHALGIKRRHGAKVIPVLTILLAYVPAVVFVGIVALIKNDSVRNDVLPTYAEYFGFISAVIFIFSAFVTPELLCPDRRSGLLGMYLASPLDRNTYLLSKAAAVTAILSIITIGPLLLILLSYTILGPRPRLATALADHVGPHPCRWSVRRRVAHDALARGREYDDAQGGRVCRDHSHHRRIRIHHRRLGVRSRSVRLHPTVQLPAPTVRVGVAHLRRKLQSQRPARARLNDIPAAVTIGVNVAWTFVFAAFVWWRYRKIQVTR